MKVEEECSSRQARQPKFYAGAFRILPIRPGARGNASDVIRRLFVLVPHALASFLVGRGGRLHLFVNPIEQPSIRNILQGFQLFFFRLTDYIRRAAPIRKATCTTPIEPFRLTVLMRLVSTSRPTHALYAYRQSA